MLKKYFPRSSFFRAASILVGGTALSQLIAVAALPILTRLYKPEDFSILAVYVAILGLVTVVSCLRFEIAIPLAKNQRQGKELLALSLISVILIAAITSLVIYIFSHQIHAVTQGKLSGYLWLVPVSVIFSGTYAAFQYWATREQQFALISKTRITQSLSGIGIQVGLGYAGVTPLGLLLGQLVNSVVGVCKLLSNFKKKNIQLYRGLAIPGLRRTFCEYQLFPKYSTFEALFNAASIQAPILVIAYYSVGPEVGFLMLATRLLSAPLGMIGGAVAQVYLAEAPAHFQNGTLRDFTRGTVRKLVMLGALPLFLIGAVAPYLVPMIFGEEWVRTGIIIIWMTPWFFFQFICSPVSMSLHITGNQKIALLLQFFGVVLRTGFVLYAAFFAQAYISEIYALTGFVFYLFYLLIIFYILAKR